MYTIRFASTRDPEEYCDSASVGAGESGTGKEGGKVKAMAANAFLLALALFLSLLASSVAKETRRSPSSPLIPHHSSLSKSTHSQSSTFFQNFTCSSLRAMVKRNQALLYSLGKRVDTIKRKPIVTADEKLKMKVLEIYKRELRASGSSLEMVLRDLNQTLGSDYRSLAQVKRSCQTRLDDMRNAAVMVEEDFNTILELEKEMHSLHPNGNLTHNPLISEIMSEIAKAADTLESEFMMADVFQDSRKQQGAALETVVKLREEALAERHNLAYAYKKKMASEAVKRNEHEGERGGMAMLVDSSSNQYVLSHPRDVTVPIEDHHLFHDIVNLFLLSFVLGTLCSLIKVPPLLGHILAGLLLGPVGYNVISSVVQVETLGEFGVIFIVFSVALDFSPEKLRKVWQVAIYGGNLLLLGGMVLGVVSGASVGVRVRVSVVVVASLSLSSAPLAHRILDSTIYTKHRTSSMADKIHSFSPIEDPPTDSSGYLSGLLVMQDIQLGTLVALMPILADDPSHTGPSSFTDMLYGFMQLLQMLCGFCLLIIIARQLTNRILEKFYRLLNSVGGKMESVLLGSVAVCFTLLVAADYLGASMELGCFLAGLAISSQGHAVVDQVKRLVEPLKDFFSVFFFASLGFHIFPTFLRSEFSMILGVTFCVLILKFLLALSILGIFSGHCRLSTWVLALGLAQVSEFSFLLASRARRLDIISREVYLIILSISSLSLLLTPLLWRLYCVGMSVSWTPVYWLPKWRRMGAAK